MKVAFLSTTMFSKNNGPANFAVGLFNLVKKTHTDIFFEFYSEDSKNEVGVTHVSTKMSSLFSYFGMVIKSFEYYNAIKDKDFDLNIWNFSVIGWFSILMNNSDTKNVVFVNDLLSLDCKFNMNYSYLRLKIFRYFESYSCKNSQRIITNSEVIKRKIIENYKVSENKINVLYKGIDIPKKNYLKIDWSINKYGIIKISFVKTNYLEGGLEMLCAALLKLKTLNFEIIIIGPQKIDKKFNGFENIKINCLGRLDKAKMYTEIISTDMFCVPCINEAFGQANIESLALQIPTIILPTEIQMKLHDKEYCWIPNECNSSSLSEKIKELVNSTDELIKTKAIIAREIVKEKYSLETTSIEFTKILQKTYNEKF